MQNLRRNGEAGNGIELNPVFKEINRRRNRIKGMLTSGKDPTDKFPTWEKQLKKSLEPDVLMQDINPRTSKTEAGRCLILGQTGLQKKF